MFQSSWRWVSAFLLKSCDLLTFVDLIKACNSHLFFGILDLECFLKIRDMIWIVKCNIAINDCESKNSVEQIR